MLGSWPSNSTDMQHDPLMLLPELNEPSVRLVPNPATLGEKKALEPQQTFILAEPCDFEHIVNLILCSVLETEDLPPPLHNPKVSK
eukprot:3635060-Amphidinium_carterae.1